MKLSTRQLYKHQEIRALLKRCPACSTSDDMTLWSTMTNGNIRKGREGITCGRCALELVFSFDMDYDCEIIDAYMLEFLKLGNLEFKNNDQQLALYVNNTYVKDISTNIIDLAKCKSLLLLS